MADDFDPAALLAALDATEAAGVPPHLVERLRALVRAEAGPIRLPVPSVFRIEPTLGFHRRVVIEWDDDTRFVADSASVVELSDRTDYEFEALGRRFAFSIPRGGIPRPR